MDVMHAMDLLCAIMWGTCAILNGSIAFSRKSPSYLFLTILNVICCVLFSCKFVA